MPEQRLPWVGVTLPASLFLSGGAALVYQVLWTRQLTLVLGSSVEAVATVVATFMAGLGLGGALAGRAADRLSRSALPAVYAGLEWGIAGAAAASPLLLGLARRGIGVLDPGAGEALPLALRVVTSASILVLPTTLMGATLPIAVALLRPRRRAVGRTAGLLYAANTLGAVSGCLGTVLVGLPYLGVAGSSRFAQGMNVAAGLCVLAVGTRLRREFRGQDGVPPSPPQRQAGPPRAAGAAPRALAPGVVAAAIALSGLGAMANEVAWTRSLILLLGPTAYAFAFILTAVIAGIAGGSAIASLYLPRLQRPGLAFAAVEAGAALSCLIVMVVVGRLPVAVGALVQTHADAVGRLMTLELAGVLVLLFVPCALFGAAFPLAVGLLSQTTTPGRATGRTYAWNTAGGVAGSLLGGFVALPTLGLERTLHAAAAVHAAIAALLLIALAPRRRWLATAALIAAVVVPLAIPRWDPELFSGGVYKYAPYSTPERLEDSLRRGELLYYEEGRSATVSVRRTGTTLSLAIDGKVDATNAGDMPTQRLLAHLPLLLHPRPRTALVIGFGSGVTAGSALTHPIDLLEAAEISPEVIEAAAFFRAANRDALSDPRLRLVLADARNHLLRSDRRYDVIISEPSNPWMAGVSALFTREHFELVRRRLAPEGLFCQWAHLYNMGPGELRSIVATFTDTFPAAALFLINESDLLLVAGRDTLSWPSPQSLTERLQLEPIASDLAEVGVDNTFTLASLYALSTPELNVWVAAATRHTDDRPILELRLPRFLHADTSLENRSQIFRAAAGAPVPEPFAGLRARAGPSELASRAEMLERSDSFEWAFESYAELLDQHPSWLPAAEGLVRCGLRLNRHGEVRDRLARLLERASGGEAQVVGRLGLGILQHHLGRPAEALAELAQVVELDPTNRRALLLGAEIQGLDGNYGAMAGLAAQALAATPGDSEAETAVAAAVLGMGRHREAVKLADQILSRDPRQAGALEVRAVALAQAGDRQRSRRAFEALVAAAPDDWSYLNNFGVFEMEAGRFEAAVALFERAVDLHPENLPGYVGLRQAAEAAGDRPRLRRAETVLRVLQGRSQP